MADKEVEADVVAALHLLMGDRTEHQRRALMAEAFPKDGWILPAGWRAADQQARSALANMDGIIAELSSPPLGLLACNKLKEVVVDTKSQMYRAFAGLQRK